MNVNQLQSFMQLQALKTLQSDNGQTQLTAGQESSAETSFQSLLQDFLGGSELSRLPLSISAFMGSDPSTSPNTQYARMNPYLSAIAGSEQLQSQSLYANDSQLNTANGIGNVLNNSYTPPLQKLFQALHQKRLIRSSHKWLKSTEFQKADPRSDQARIRLSHECCQPCRCTWTDAAYAVYC